MHDSGARQGFATGAVRDTAEGKTSFRLLSPHLLVKWPVLEVQGILFRQNNPDSKRGNLLADIWCYVQLFRITCESKWVLRALERAILLFEDGDEALARLSAWCERGAKKYSREDELPVADALSKLVQLCSCEPKDQQPAIRSDRVSHEACVGSAMFPSTQKRSPLLAIQDGSRPTSDCACADRATTSGCGSEIQSTRSGSGKITEFGESGTLRESATPTGNTSSDRSRDVERLSALGERCLRGLASPREKGRLYGPPKGAGALSVDATRGDDASITTTPPEPPEGGCVPAATWPSDSLTIVSNALSRHSATCRIRQRVSLKPADRATHVRLFLSGERNWELGMPFSRVIDSECRHLRKEMHGNEDEDHPAAILWNLMALLHYIEEVRAGGLPAELDDLPRYGAANRPEPEVLPCGEA